MSKSAAKVRIRKYRRVAQPSNQPGQAIKPEDVVRDHEVRPLVNNVMHLRPVGRREAAPMVRGGQRLSRAEVWEKLERAMKTLRALPDRERRFFAVKSGYPEFIRDYIDAYGSVEAIAPRHQPTPQDVSEYLEVLSWTRHLEKSEWRMLWWRSFGLSFGLIGEYIGRSDETARKRFENALTGVWIAANNS